MIATSTRTLRVAAFGDLDQGIWGVLLDGGGEPRLAVRSLGADGPASLVEAALASDGDTWHVTAGSHVLEISPAAPTAHADADDASVELCRVTGTAEIDGQQVECNHAGIRLTDGAPLDRVDSVRFAGAWFEGCEGVALLAARPRGAKGQDRDELAVALLGEPDGITVFDPRLSSTYSADGAPRRLGIELWLGESHDGDQYPRRTAGEALGAPVAALSSDQLRIDAYPMRCHSRGLEGLGAYVLIRPA